MEQKSARSTLLELALLFLKLGLTAFGGPTAHIAMMEDEVVRRRKWISKEEFLDLLSAANLIPGPNSTELAIHIGHRRAGWLGLLVAGICFILPAFFIVVVIAKMYVIYGKLPETEALLSGIKPVIIAVVVQALWGLGKSALKNGVLTCICITAALANFFGAGEVTTLLVAGTISCMATEHWPKVRTSLKLGIVTILGIGTSIKATAVAMATQALFSLSQLFLFFVKVGSVLFGSGYVLLSFLRSDLVEKWHWLTETQLLDAIAVGQFTPGPVFTTASFIGYILSGWRGAIVATTGIFLPAFFFVAISAPFLPHLRKSVRVGSFLDGVNVASLALMAVVSLQLGKVAIVDALTATLGVLTMILLTRFKVNSVFLVIGGAFIGLIRAKYF